MISLRRHPKRKPRKLLPGSQKLLLKDLKDFSKHKSFFDDARAVLSFDRNDCQVIRVTLLPANGHFRNCLVVFQLTFTGFYPKSKPKPQCLTRIFHPNISSSGGVCFTLFDSHWNSDLKLIDYVNGFLYLLAIPNHDDPLNSSCVEKDPKKYDEFVQKGASGEVLGGQKYDFCIIKQKVEKSTELEKISKDLELFKDRNNIIVELEKTIKSFREDYKKSSFYNNFAEKIDELMGEVTIHSGGRQLDEFDQDKFLQAKKRCEEFVETVNRIFVMSGKLQSRVEDVKKKFGDSQTTSHGQRAPINEHLRRVSQAFQRTFPPAREVIDGVVEVLLRNNEIFSNHGDEQERIIQGFITRCDAVIALELRIRVYMQQVYDRLKDDNINNFVQQEFAELTSLASDLYAHLRLFRSKEEEVLAHQRLLEVTKMVEDVLQTAQLFLELEQEFQRICSIVSSTPDDNDKIRQHILLGICTFQVTGRQYSTQRWWNCPECSRKYGIGRCCETCKDTCHKDHEGIKEAYRSPARFFCECGQNHQDNGKCQGMMCKNNLDPEEFQRMLQERKKKFLEKKKDIRRMLDGIHERVREEREGALMETVENIRLVFLQCMI